MTTSSSLDEGSSTSDTVEVGWGAAAVVGAAAREGVDRSYESRS
jgi:hypothetical protein